MYTQEGVYFKNRQHAGKVLGLFLKPKYKHLNPLILGIPRGGVEVAYFVALCLNAELSVVISKKLPFPGHPEFGFGAVAEEYSVYVSPAGKELLSSTVINQIIEKQILEINRRIDIYRHGKSLPEMSGRLVILVDDGIATGVTLVPVLKLCQKKGAAKIVIAAPVSGTSYDSNLKEADAIEILIQPYPLYSVGQVYQRFGGNLTDEYIQKILLKAGLTNSKNEARQ